MKTILESNKSPPLTSRNKKKLKLNRDIRKEKQIHVT